MPERRPGELLLEAAQRVATDAVYAARDSGESMHGAGAAAAAAVLSLLEPIDEHLVDLGEDSFTVTHPLTERFADTMHECPLHGWLRAQDGPPRSPGRYRATRDETFISEGCGAAWNLEPVGT